MSSTKLNRYSRSEKLFARALELMPGGVNSPVRAFRAVGGTPRFIKHASGATITDVDGRSYIDYLGSWGPMILGYRHPAIVEAMRRRAELPADYGAQHELEFLVSEQIQKLMPCAALVAFTSSGSATVAVLVTSLLAVLGASSASVTATVQLQAVA